MTEPPQEEEVVHYNISMTAKQAAAFFVVLLVALSLAFFFGMKTGAAARRSQGAEPGTSISELARDEKKPAVIEADRTGDAGEKKASRSQPEIPAGKAPEPSFGFSDETDRKASSGSGPGKTEPPAAKTTSTTAPVPTKPATPSRTAVPTPATTAKSTPTEKAAAKEQLFVQVLATNDPAKADQLRKQLKEAGFKTADVSPVPGKADLFRVRTGPYSDRATAEKVIERLKKPFPNVKPSIVKP